MTPHARLPLAAVAVAAAALFGITALAVSGGGNDDKAVPADIEQTRPVTVTANAQGAPAVQGQSFDGAPVSIAPDGRPKLVVFLAHWCPHCRNEVPVITKWLADKGAPQGVDIYAVSTSVNANAVNYPPSAWLQRERFPVPTLADDRANSVARAFGVTGFPYFVAVTADGRIAEREAGELPVSRVEALVALARQG